MLSNIPKAAPQIRFQNIESKQYSFKNIGQCSELRRQIWDASIRKISADMKKNLQAITRTELIEARNRVDVPHGLFGLLLQNFYERRKENTVYLDVLELVCRETLESAKLCVVLEELQNIIVQLFSGYHNKKIRPILKMIADSKKLLTISESIAVEFQKNNETLRVLRDKLNAFSVRETNAVSYMNNQVYAVQNNCIESELVLDPVELRYKMSYHTRITDQSRYKLNHSENILYKKLNWLNDQRQVEDTVTDSIRLKQRIDIEMLKSRLDEMSKRFERDDEELDGKISYKINAMEAMQGMYRDCLAKLDFFEIEVAKLRVWEATKRDSIPKVYSYKTKKGGKRK